MKTLPIERHEEAREVTKPLAPPDLREQVIARIEAERERFCMREWGNSSKPGELECGTIGCLAGFILLVCGETFDWGIPSTPPAERWLEREMDDHPEGSANTLSTPARAREFWASVYGEESARALPFYEYMWEADEVIDYLRSEVAG